jgi:hypothetical protein
VPLAHATIPNNPTTNAKNILRAPRAQTNRARKVNKILRLHPKGTWTIKILEEAMDIIEKGHFSMKRAN